MSSSPPVVGDNNNMALPSSDPVQAIGIGSTPLILLKKIPKHAGLKCKIYAKCEFRNPTGTIMDRVVKAVLDNLDPTNPPPSFICGPDPEFCTSLLLQTREKFPSSQVHAYILSSTPSKVVQKLKNFDANLTLLENVETLVTMKEELKRKEESGSVNLIQPLGEYVPQVAQSIAQEILASEVVPNIFVAEKNEIMVLVGKILQGSLGSDAVSVLLVDLQGGPKDKETVWVTEKMTFRTARDLNLKEDLYCGNRSGAVVAAAVLGQDDEASQKLRQREDLVILTVLPEKVEFSDFKFLDVEWMKKAGYMPEGEFSSLYWWYLMGVGNLTAPGCPSIGAGVTLEKCSQALDAKSPRIVWKSKSRRLEDALGVVTHESLQFMKAKGFDPERTLEDGKEYFQQFGTLNALANLSDLDVLLRETPFVILYTEDSEMWDDCEELQVIKNPVALVSFKHMNEWVYSVEEHHRLQYGWEPGVGYEPTKEKEVTLPPTEIDINTNEISK